MDWIRILLSRCAALIHLKNSTRSLTKNSWRISNSRPRRTAGAACRKRKHARRRCVPSVG